jgi:hypothetical protein
MAKKKPSTDVDVIGEITKIRVNTNILWMEILKTALRLDPIGSRILIKAIKKNDKAVTKWLGKL